MRVIVIFFLCVFDCSAQDWSKIDCGALGQLTANQVDYLDSTIKLEVSDLINHLPDSGYHLVRIDFIQTLKVKTDFFKLEQDEFTHIQFGKYYYFDHQISDNSVMFFLFKNKSLEALIVGFNTSTIYCKNNSILNLYRRLCENG